jgi:hypothetical protein
VFSGGRLDVFYDPPRDERHQDMIATRPLSQI